MKRSFLMVLIIAGLFFQSCTVENIYSVLNDRWGLQLPKAVTIIDDATNSDTYLTSSTKNSDYLFVYQEEDSATLDKLPIWSNPTNREINQLIQLIHPYFFTDETKPLTPAQRLEQLEEKLGMVIDENLKYYSKRDSQSPTGGRIILLYDDELSQIHAFHLVE